MIVKDSHLDTSFLCGVDQIRDNSVLVLLRMFAALRVGEPCFA